jgi:metal-sulfur cluster biosynthetic enzyme
MSNHPGTNRPIWDAETDNPDLAEKVKEGLAEIVDPEIGLNVIQLGLIRNVHIEPDNAVVKMILTTPFCPYGPAMIEAIRQKAESVLNRPTNIDLGMDMWDFSMMEEGLGADWGLY